eukprot:2762302-Lingulodinium_polyedra.AAC.5
MLQRTGVQYACACACGQANLATDTSKRYATLVLVFVAMPTCPQTQAHGIICLRASVLVLVAVVLLNTATQNAIDHYANASRKEP